MNPREGVRQPVTEFTIFGCRLSCHLNFVARAVRKLNGLRSQFRHRFTRRLADLFPAVTVSHAAITPLGCCARMYETYKGVQP